MIRCIVVEDEPLAQQILTAHIRKIPNLEVVAICNNAREAFDVLANERIELMFLDIKLPSVNGIDFLKALKEPPACIFTTAYSEYAIDSYELDALDYLLKPITFDRFNISIQKYRKLYNPSAQIKDYTFFKINGRFQKIEHNEILFAHSVKDYIVIYTLDDVYIAHMTMKYLSALLPASKFKRVHRSYLINTDKVDSFGKHSFFIAQHQIPMSKQYVSNQDLRMLLREI